MPIGNSRINSKETKPRKFHTSLYLLPRHRIQLDLMMSRTGLSQNDLICALIDDEVRNELIGEIDD